jgi:MFS transporter, PAT family, beta-lactamase induction signal transducer AmpG
MPPQSFAKPYYIFFLVLPAGISNGFVTVALPFLLTKNGFPVAETAGIVALGLAANLWRFLWGPIADLSLSLRKWFGIGVVASATMLLLLCFTPLTVKGAVLLSVIVFISQVAATFIMLPVGGFMAHRIKENRKGSAGGWFQAGNLGGTGLGGGAGLWLATHYNIAIAGIVLAAASILFALAVLMIEDVKQNKEKSVAGEMIMMGKDILSMLRIPIVLFTIIFICLPVGTGALSNIWSAIAADWKTDADAVALVTGLLSGLISALGCVAGGFIADRWGNWMAYFSAGIGCAIITVAMSLLPFKPYMYIAGVLAYSFGSGMAYAAFSAVLLFAIGKKNASTKYSLLSSLGNLPVVYMTAFDGWAHDSYNSKYMLVADAVICVLFVMISAVVLNRMKAKKMLVNPYPNE